MQEFFKDRKKIIIAVVGILAVLLVAVGVVSFNKASIQNKLNNELSIARQYLDENDFANAIASFDRALEIDPLCVDAYLGKAEVYAVQGDYDGAIGVLNKGYELTQDELLKDKIDEYEAELKRIAEEKRLEEERLRREQEEREAEERRLAEEARPYMEKNGIISRRELEHSIPIACGYYKDGVPIDTDEGWFEAENSNVVVTGARREPCSDRPGYDNCYFEFNVELNYTQYEVEYLSRGVEGLLSFERFDPVDYYSGVCLRIEGIDDEEHKGFSNQAVVRNGDKEYDLYYQVSRKQISPDGNWRYSGGGYYEWKDNSVIHYTALFQVPHDYDGLCFYIPSYGMPEPEVDGVIDLEESRERLLLDYNPHTKVTPTADEIILYRFDELVDMF